VGASLHQQGRRRRGGGPMPAREGRRGGRLVPTGEGWRGGRPVPAQEVSGVVVGLCRRMPLGSGDGGERVVGERADPFCCSIRFDEENGREG